MMMRLWFGSYARRAWFALATAWAVSLGVHSALISLAVLGTKPVAGLEPEGLANRVVYLPPPDHVPTKLEEPRETLHFVALSPDLFGPGVWKEAPPKPPAARGNEPPPPPVSAAPDSTELQRRLTSKDDSVFTVLEVDTAVVRTESSAAPAYPLAMLDKKIMGSVLARYIVDTTGFADTASFQVMRSTRAEFVAAVRAALPYMRFSPAKMGQRKVPQLVEQEFKFKIAPPADAGKP